MAKELAKNTEDPILIEWKKNQVKQKMQEFERRIAGKKKDLFVKALEINYPHLDGKVAMMTIGVSTDNPEDQIFNYSTQITNVTRWITSTSRKYGAEPQRTWNFFRPSSQLPLDHYERTFSFPIEIKKMDRLMFRAGKTSKVIYQALHGLARK